MTTKTVRAIVSGKVQGVGFRMSTRDRARQLRVSGFVRNLSNGNVELVATGEKEKVDFLIDWAKSGPPSAQVEDLQLEVMDNNNAEFSSFEIRR
ncbi:MAG: acylphosphatase [Pleurocapsa sp. MO_226.B13]|nr:acylphosphatase [Pleurocapsa sp. MO_226.B13]